MLVLEAQQVRQITLIPHWRFLFQSWIPTYPRTDPPVQLTQTLAEDRKEHVPSKGPSLSGKPTTKDKKVELVYRSVLSQQVPIEGLSHLESDHPVHVVKKFMVDMANGLVDKLLEIAPALVDNLDPKAAEDDPDAADDTMSSTVVRNWFRRLVLARGQPDVLDLASRHTTIIGFLRSGVEVGELRQYVEYFENVDGDALRHLRRAIGDSFLAVNRPTINLLGGSVSTDDEIEELSTERWDMVFNHFENVIPWDLLPCLYMSFADNLHLSKLLLLNRYGQDWLPEENPLRDCICGTFLGFVVSTQGFCDPPLPKIAAEGHRFRGTEYRNYIAGRMSTKDPLAEALFAELKRRTRHHLVGVWKGPRFEGPLFQSEEDIFIHRTRTAKTQNDLSNAPWDVLLDLRSVKSDLRRLRAIHGETYEDYLQFLVIDREPGMPFTLIDMIQDVLVELNGDQSPEKIMQDAVKDIIPLDERDIYLDAVVVGLPRDTPWPEMNFNQVRYEGNRSRCWDVDQVLPKLLESRSGTKVPVEDSRFISALCKDLESKGSIRIMEEFVASQGIACAFPGTDGKLDLYIDYRPLLATAQPNAALSKFDLPPDDSLLRFAKTFDYRNAAAIYIKGSIVIAYCTWPMDAIGPLSRGLPNFTTPAGHIYQWVKQPFDYPITAQIWQYKLKEHFQECAEFACFYLTTFVVCALDKQDAHKKIRRLFEVAQKHGLRLRVPPVSSWAEDCEKMGLDKIYNGVRPAGYES